MNTIQGALKKFTAASLLLFGSLLSCGAVLDFNQEPLRAGKQLLAEDAYYISCHLGTAKFTPSTPIPLRLSYQSNRQEKGLFGTGWRANLLESSLQENVWKTPWGETIILSEQEKRFEKADRVIAGINECEGWQFLYLFGKLQKIVTPEHKIIEFTYDGPEGKVSAVSSAGVDFIRIKYNQAKLPESIVLNGVSYRLRFRSDSLLQSIQQGNLVPITFRYDGRKHLTVCSRGTIIDSLKIGPKGELLSDSAFQYRRSDDGVTLTDSNHDSIKMEWKKNRLTLSNQHGAVSIAEYQPSADPSFPGAILYYQKLQGEKEKIQVEYDPKFNRMIRLTDLYGNAIVQKLDSKGHPTQVLKQNASDSSAWLMETIEYNRLGLPEEIRTLTPNGEEISKQNLMYNSDLQISEISQGDKNLRFQYNNFGFPEATICGGEKTQEILYDDYNRVTTIFGPRQMLFTKYNANGQPLYCVHYSSKTNLVTIEKYQYDNYGDLSEITNHRDEKVKLERDGQRRLCAQYDPNGGCTRYQYDAAGNLIAVTDPNGNPLRFEYGIHGMTKQITAENQVTERIYDSEGQLTELLSYFEGKRQTPDRVIKYEYDSNGKTIRIDYGKGFVQNRTYDKSGRLHTVTRTAPDEKRTAELLHDPEGRLLRREEHVSAKGTEAKIVYEYQYDIEGRRTEVSIQSAGGSRTVTYLYDASGNISQIASGDSSIEYEYDKGDLVRQVINQTPITYSYDQFGRLAKKEHPGGIVLAYEYFPDGRIKGRVQNGQVEVFIYDKNGQLTHVFGPKKKLLEQYDYDPAGNILSTMVNGVKTTFTYDKANQLVSETRNGKRKDFRYDAAGRMIFDGLEKIEYGDYNSVIKYGQTPYSYDAFGRLASAGNETFLWDAFALWERNGEAYLFEPAETGGNPILSGDKLIFTDLHGSSIGYTQNDKTVSLPRSAFGVSPTQDLSCDFFTGKPFVGNLGYHFPLRDYNPRQAKWTTSDPLGYPDGWNNLQYLTNDPINFIDITGGEKSVSGFFRWLFTESGKQSLSDNVGAYVKYSLVPGLSVPVPGFAMLYTGYTGLQWIHDAKYHEETLTLRRFSSDLLGVSASLAGAASGVSNAVKPTFKDLGITLATHSLEIMPDISKKKQAAIKAVMETEKQTPGMEKTTSHVPKSHSPKKNSIKATVVEVVADDEPAEVVRTFFRALEKGDIRLAESFIEPSNLSLARKWINQIMSQYCRVWIGPHAYVNGGMAAVDFTLGNKRHFLGRHDLLLVKMGNRWLIRFGAVLESGIIPDAISEQNTKCGMSNTGFVKMPRVTVPMKEFRSEYIVVFK